MSDNPILVMVAAVFVGIVLLIFWGSFTNALNSTPAVQQMSQQAKGNLQQIENTGTTAIELSQTELIEAVALVMGVAAGVIYGLAKLFDR